MEEEVIFHRWFIAATFLLGFSFRLLLAIDYKIALWIPIFWFILFSVEMKQLQKEEKKWLED